MTFFTNTTQVGEHVLSPLSGGRIAFLIRMGNRFATGQLAVAENDMESMAAARPDLVAVMYVCTLDAGRLARFSMLPKAEQSVKIAEFDYALSDEDFLAFLTALNAESKRIEEAKFTIEKKQDPAME